MDLQLKGKTAFISGSSQGIGFAIAEQLLREGASVFINGRNEEKLQQAVAQLQPLGPVKGIAGDIAVIADQIPPVDILVNNVGIFDLKSFFDLTDEEWLHFFNVNVMSSVRLSRALMPAMLENNWGRIIFISSESGVNIPANMIHYGMTKTAMLSISRGLAQLTKGTAVTVNTILGGPTYSDGVKMTIEAIAAAQDLSAEVLKENIFAATNPGSLLQRFLQPSEIAQLATYLASPLSIATNGAALRADGGVLNTIL
ncbi:SDR family NAD(P)-dependent oxidoreductase [Chitinophaga sancti]|uniref:NAD(P)-dependent dehydrogenase, short-chain alcohol dehydrogenase family n=1 Tax=Chitinophaga sancti TaxID=1004 RepID=A0A1K1SWN8_9BACT|nr:SDR family oxidoreductase [Chitinophaga sancti]WQD63127.1 SDR family oxidoreductase [Chitinophaga sancti]WQG91248.1 SDR family oxidoreductase [Chitinophaga sancti]SFW88718.1 NAD(P)-dependent dehydrogenase, short-chain alcohol dehydrogenase family [Chitinophaga sancti]